MDEAVDWIALRATPGVGDVLGRRLIAHFGRPADVLVASAQALVAAGFRPHQAERLVRRLAVARGAEAAEDARRIEAHGARLISCLDAEYPAPLQHLADAPLTLVASGTMLGSGPALAIVGSRRATPYGRDVARQLGEDLAHAGFAIVSGLARGIDAAAHRGALRAGGVTIAVLGSGLDRIYPPEHSDLAAEITATGTLLTERPMRALPLAPHFPARNRIIAGMTVGTIVVEAAGRSGALITARMALEAGREVFAVPGRIDSPVSAGPHALLQDGAKLVRHVGDVLDELGPALRRESEPATDPASGSAHDDPLLACLAGGPVGIDRLVRESGLPAADVLARVLDLELRGLVTQRPGQQVELFSRTGARLPRPVDSSKGGNSPQIGE